MTNFPSYQIKLFLEYIYLNRINFLKHLNYSTSANKGFFLIFFSTQLTSDVVEITVL